MKTFLFLLFTLAICTAQAQIKIMSFEEAEQKGFSEEHLDSLIRLKENKAVKNQHFPFKGENAFTRRQNKIAQQIFGKREGGMFHYKLYLTKDEDFNFLLYGIDGKVSKENKYLFLDSLQVIVDNYRAELTITEPQVWNYFLRLGVIRQFPKGKKGVINQIEEAIATTRPDTVKVLALNQLELTSVPDFIYRFMEMKELVLSDNELKTADIDLNRLPKLRHIWLNGNKLTQESLLLPKNKTLKILNIQNNRLSDVPQAVRNCKKLTSLWLGYNKLTNLNANSFKDLRKLQDLNLYSCEIENVPKEIAKLRRLEVLDLYYNQLTELPNSLGRMRRLQQLAIANNQLKSLPTALGRMKRLQTLYAHHNKLETLPTHIQRLRRLRILDINNNQFSTLPNQIGKLRRVEDLDISNNNLSEVPKELLQLQQLKKLYLRANPFSKDMMLLSRSKPILESLENNKTDVSY